MAKLLTYATIFDLHGASAGLSAWVPVGAGDARRLATLEAGGMVGELAFLGREQRTTGGRTPGLAIGVWGGALPG